MTCKYCNIRVVPLRGAALTPSLPSLTFTLRLNHKAVFSFRLFERQLCHVEHNFFEVSLSDGGVKLESRSVSGSLPIPLPPIIDRSEDQSDSARFEISQSVCPRDGKDKNFTAAWRWFLTRFL